MPITALKQPQCGLQVLQQLSTDLAMSVLQASKCSLDIHLSMLPQTLHPIAIRAAYTAGSPTHSLHLNLVKFSSATSEAVMQYLHTSNEATSDEDTSSKAPSNEGGNFDEGGNPDEGGKEGTPEGTCNEGIPEGTLNEGNPSEEGNQKEDTKVSHLHISLHTGSLHDTAAAQSLSSALKRTLGSQSGISLSFPQLKRRTQWDTTYLEQYFMWLQDITSALKENSSLRSLSVSHGLCSGSRDVFGSETTPDEKTFRVSLDFLGGIINRLKGLRSLSLHQMSVNESVDESREVWGFQPKADPAQYQQRVLGSLDGLTQLTHLELDRTLGHPQTLKKALKGLKKLRSLSFVASWMPSKRTYVFGGARFEPICVSVGQMTSLTHLSMSVEIVATIGWEGPTAGRFTPHNEGKTREQARKAALKLTSVLPSLHNILQLDLSGCLLTPGAVRNVTQGLLQYWGGLQGLSVHVEAIEASTLCMLDALCAAASLTRLSFEVAKRNDMHGVFDGGQASSREIKNKEGLVGHESIPVTMDHADKELAVRLAQLTSLQQLHLHGCTPHAAGLRMSAASRERGDGAACAHASTGSGTSAATAVAVGVGHKRARDCSIEEDTADIADVQSVWTLSGLSDISRLTRLSLGVRVSAQDSRHRNEMSNALHIHPLKGFIPYPLGTFSKLLCLEIRSVQLKVQATKQFAAALSQLTQLEVLSLQQCSFQHRLFGSCLQQAFSHLTRLSQLLLRGISDSFNNCANFSAISGPINLKRLAIVQLQDPSEDSAASVLADAFTELTKLEELDLTAHFWAPDGAIERLSGGIQNLVKLHRLSVAHEDITHDGVVAVSQSVCSLSCLKTLKLTFKRASLEGGGEWEQQPIEIVIGALISGNVTSLEELDLSAVDFVRSWEEEEQDDEARLRVEMLSKLLDMNPALRSVEVPGWPLMRREDASAVLAVLCEDDPTRCDAFLCS